MGPAQHSSAQDDVVRLHTLTQTCTYMLTHTGVPSGRSPCSTTATPTSLLNPIFSNANGLQSIRIYSSSFGSGLQGEAGPRLTHSHK